MYPVEKITLDTKLLHNQRLWWLWQIWGVAKGNGQQDQDQDHHSDHGTDQTRVQHCHAFWCHHDSLLHIFYLKRGRDRKRFSSICVVSEARGQCLCQSMGPGTRTFLELFIFSYVVLVGRRRYMCEKSNYIKQLRLSFSWGLLHPRDIAGALLQQNKKDF